MVGEALNPALKGSAHLPPLLWPQVSSFSPIQLRIMLKLFKFTFISFFFVFVFVFLTRPLAAHRGHRWMTLSVCFSCLPCAVSHTWTVTSGWLPYRITISGHVDRILSDFDDFFFLRSLKLLN